MNIAAFQCLEFIRSCQAKNDPFNRGYVLGHINAIKYDFEPWVRVYLEHIANQIIWEGKSA